MLAPGLLAWNEYVTVPDNAAVVEAVGQQWQWTFRYPGRRRRARHGRDRPCHAGQSFRASIRAIPTAATTSWSKPTNCTCPLGRPVKMVLRSKDVLHDFYVPQFRAKMDLVPGIVTYFWMTPTVAGSFDILCAELCGVGHHTMRGTVVVERQAEFDRWLVRADDLRPAARVGGGPRRSSLRAADAPRGKGLR